MTTSLRFVRITAGLLVTMLMLPLATIGPAAAYPIAPDSTPAAAGVVEIDRPAVGEVPYADIQADALTRSGAVEPGALTTDDGSQFGVWGWAIIGASIIALLAAALYVTARPRVRGGIKARQ